MDEFLRQIEHARRWKWLIVTAGIFAALAGLALTYSKEPAYTANATLLVGSASGASNRTPDQDAVVARGYVERIARDQGELRRGAGLSPEVSILATLVADSPFVQIAATAPSEEEAVRAANDFAEAFSRQTTDAYQALTDQRLEPLRASLERLSNEIAQAQAELDVVVGVSASRRAQLEGRLIALTAERSGIDTQLEQVSAVPGNPNLVGTLGRATDAVASSRNLVTNGVLALIGGLVLGTAAALTLGALELRFSSPGVVRSRLGIPTLAVIPGSEGAQRQEALRSLASSSALMTSGLASVAVTSPGVGEGKTLVARNLAHYRAALGDRVVLVDGNLRAARLADRRDKGLAELLQDDGGLEPADLLVPSEVPNLSILPAGAPLTEPYALFTRDRVGRVLEAVAPYADLLVIDTPAVLAASESQVLCSLADRVILVLHSVRTRPSAAAEARDVLERIHARMLGVVLTGTKRKHLSRSGPRRRPAAPAPKVGAKS